MPNPRLYLTVVAAAALVSAAVAWLAKRCRLPANAICVPALVAGIICGAWLLKLPLSWPPANGLGRVLMLLLPAVVAAELLAAAVLCFAPGGGRLREPSDESGGQLPGGLSGRWEIRASNAAHGLGWFARLTLAMAATPVVLARSVYVSGDTPLWSAGYTVYVLLASGGLLAATWFSLQTLARRSGGVSLLLVLAQTAVCGGLAIMLKGYQSGGEAGLPLAGALLGCGLGCVTLKLPKESSVAAIGISVVVLFGLLYVGRFFGQLSTPRTLALLLAPSLCWVSELKPLSQRPPEQLGLLRLALVAVPLAVVVLLAKNDFDRDTRPLLGRHAPDSAFRQEVSRTTSDSTATNWQIMPHIRKRGVWF